MRFALLLVAGLIGWLWFATREPESSAAPAPARARRADLGELNAQVAAAATRARVPIVAIAAIDDDEIGGDEEDGPPSSELEGQTHEFEEQARDADLSELTAQLEAAAARDVEDPTVVPNDDEAVGHEIIQIMGSAPIIDTTTTTHCGGFEQPEYTYNIPTGRTFEGVLGAAADSQGQEDGIDEGVTFSSAAPIDNTYVVEEDILVENHVVED